MDAEKTLDYAWKYFQLHAQQRTTIFNFYVVFTGLLVTGIATASRDFPQNVFLIASLGCFLTGLSFLFYKLDQRVSFLIKHAEEVIKKHEPTDVRLFNSEASQTNTARTMGLWTYGKSFRTVFMVMAAVGVIVLFVSVYGMLAESSAPCGCATYNVEENRDRVDDGIPYNGSLCFAGLPLK